MIWCQRFKVTGAHVGAVTTFILRAVGYFFCVAWLSSLFAVRAAVCVAVYLAALHSIARHGGRGVLWRMARMAALLVLVPLYVLWLGMAIVLGDLLGWALPSGMVIIAGAAAVAAGMTYRHRWGAVQIPPNLALGVWIGGCLFAWWGGDASVRCNDLHRAVQQAGVQIVVPTVPLLTRCDPDDRIPIGRYPSKIFEAADGLRYLFTTGVSAAAESGAGSAFDGSVCESLVRGNAGPRCVGTGTGHGIIDAPFLGSFFAPVHGAFDDARGLIYVIPNREPLSIAATLRAPLSTWDGFYDDRSDRLGIFSNAEMIVLLLRGSTLAPLPSRPMATWPNDVRFDPARHQGIVCSAGEFPPSGLAALFDADPFQFRSIGVTPWAFLALSSGCDWDVASGVVEVAAPALGLLTEVDLDSGGVVRSRFIGPGVRAVSIDARRHRIYVGDYFRGEVRALDADSARETAHWFVGRYLNDLRLTRDGHALLAASTLGVLRIDLESAG